jgi:GH24 family phage-related lysozyme (muramidase)
MHSIIKYLLLIVLLSINNQIPVKKNEYTLNRLVIEKQQDTNYNYAISIIKKWETYSSTRYRLFNDEYIGYGHLLYESDTISILSELQANSLLKADYNKAFKAVGKLCPKLPARKKHLLAMFAFNCGIGTLRNSKLLKNIITGAPDSLIKQQYYTYVFAGKRHLPKLILRRMDEFAIW